MRKVGMVAAFAAACMLVLAGAASTRARQDNTNSGMNSNRGDAAMMPNSSDKKFMSTAASGGMAEVEMARLALEKSQNDAVKQYAQKMIDDHTAAGEELKALASSKGVMLPSGPDAKSMALMAKMRNASGMEFDMMYVKEAGVKAHEKMEKLFMKQSMARGGDADAKAFAAKTLPTVQMHLGMARDMMKTMHGSGGMSGMKM